MSGWIKLHRKILKSQIFKNPELLKVWTWCLLKATHQDYKQIVGLQVVELKPGQFVYGRKQAADELGMSESKVRRFIDLLEDAGNLTRKPTNKFSVITVENWGVYQGEESENDQQMTNKRPTDDQQMTTNKNIKNIKNNNAPFRQRGTGIEPKRYPLFEPTVENPNSIPLPDDLRAEMIEKIRKG